MRFALAALGFTTTIAQIVLMRELVATFYGNELLFGLALMAWLVWGAVGSWGLGRFAERWNVGRGKISLLLVLAGLLLPLQMMLVRGARFILGVKPGALVEFAPMVITVVLLLTPLCLVGGLLFTLGARLGVKEGSTPGQAYVWESSGAVVGGGLFSFVLIRYLDPFQTALLVVIVNLAVAGGLLLLNKLWRRSSIALFLIVLSLLILFGYPVGQRLNQATLGWQWAHLVFAADSAYGRITVQALGSQRSFFENGLLAFETQGTFPEEVTHFPLLEHPEPKQVLLIGGGVAGDLREILKHPVQAVTYVELDPLLIEAARDYLPPEETAVLADPRVKLNLNDGRVFVKSAPRIFDVVILDLPEPATGALNRFYTREFFSEVEAILKPGGVFSLGLPSAENYWSPELAQRNASLYHTLVAVFSHVMVLPGEHNFFLASDSPLVSDPSILAERLLSRGIENRWVTPAYLKYLLSTDRFSSVQQELGIVGGWRINEDLHPICYYYDMILWLSRFYPRLHSVFNAATPNNSLITIIGWMIVPLVLLVGMARWRPRWAMPVVVAGTGFSQLTLEMVIIFAFQVLHGSVYGKVSLIITAFMAGLAVGGIIGSRLLGRARGDCRFAQRVLGGVQLAIVVLSACLALMLVQSIYLPTWSYLLLALLSGSLSGLAFPLGVGLTEIDSRYFWSIDAAGVLYGTDLLGGCLGALLGATLFIPLLGIPQTCMLVVLVAFAGVVVLG
jgi:spermidine synthase